MRCYVAAFMIMNLWTKPGLGEKLPQTNININRIPDLIKQTPDFIKKFGYPPESHAVMTDDGYVLIIHRILAGRDQPVVTGKPVVFVQHGVLASSDQWVFRGPRDLVFMLADEGYDVWLGNTRGSFYSRNVRYTPSDAEYWDYSLHELGNGDLPAMLDYVLNVTEQPHLSYIGHSRGGAMAVILLSSQPEYNKKINLVVGLGPVIYTTHSTSPLFAVFGPNSPIRPAQVQGLFRKARINSLAFTTRSFRSILQAVCDPKSPVQKVCLSTIFIVTGEDFVLFDRSLAPIIISHFTMGISVKEGVHFIQIAESDRFQRFDYGRIKNNIIYGQSEPPVYNVSSVSVPLAVYYGANDLLTSEVDLKRLCKEVQNCIGVNKIPFDKWNHMDYMWAKNADKFLYDDVIKTVNKYNKNRTNEV